MGLLLAYTVIERRDGTLRIGAIVSGSGDRNNGRIGTMSVETLKAGRRPTLVREDRDFYIPDYLSDKNKSRPDLYAAADDHARDLREAERYLDDALNLAGTLRAACEDVGDSRAMQVDTVLKFIEESLGRAHAAIDRHDTRFMNLFMAYFDLRGAESSAGEE